MDPYSAYDKNDGKMRFFARTIGLPFPSLIPYACTY
jgi:hypothetical protein